MQGTPFQHSTYQGLEQVWTRCHTTPVGYRLGGMLLSPAAVGVWASKLSSQQLDGSSKNMSRVWGILKRHAGQHRIFFRPIGATADDVRYMLVTHSEPFPNWRKVDLSSMPKFEEDNERAQVARRLLE